MRPDPGLPPPPVGRGRAGETFEVETITRLFGGGVETKRVDPRCWLRPPAVKSAIRSWWRAAAAHRYASIAALREAESKLFGSPATYDAAGRVQGGPGAVSVRVRPLKSPTTVKYDIEMGDALGVAYFAGAPLGNEAASLMPPGARAQVQLDFGAGQEKAPEEVLEAVRLWLTLGGAGARGRRGAGALGLRTSAAARALGVPADPEELAVFLAARCRRAPCEAVESVFCLARTRRVLLGPLSRTGEDAQRKLLAALREARQDRVHPDSWRGGDWGVSRWPEADAIRLLEGRGPYLHDADLANAGRYPRAALGLPIVFHFKHDPKKDRRPEPKNHTALASLPAAGGPKAVERYASPILLRPVRVWRGRDEQYVPVALFTDCLLPRGAAPLIVTGEGAKRAEHLVSGYDLQAHADETLARVEAVFLRFGFHPPEEAR